MFFIESSGRDHLLIRQTCAIESAVRNSKIDQFYVVMTSPNLNVTANNATCQLFKRYSNVIFRHVDLDVLFEETPLQELHSGKVVTLVYSEGNIVYTFTICIYFWHHRRTFEFLLDHHEIVCYDFLQYSE